MPQYVFPADAYDNGTLLSSLGWSTITNHEYQVVEIGATGRKYWNPISGTEELGDGAEDYQQGMIFDSIAASTDHEILLLGDFASTEVGADRHTFSCQVNDTIPGSGALGDDNFAPKYTLRARDSGSVDANDFNMASVQLDNVPDMTPIGQAAALRMQLVGGLVKVWAWASAIGGLEAAEPAGETFRGTISGSIASYPTVSSLLHPIAADRSVYSVISIGTGGDPAPYALPLQTVITPTALSVTGIDANNATLNWT